MKSKTTPVCPTSSTFYVDDVELGKLRFGTDKIHERLANLTKCRIEACSDYHTDVCSNHDYQPLLAAVYSAYCHHLPLVLGPDAVWLTIAQGVAQHMAIRGESLRRRFVTHDGTIELKVDVTSWLPRSPENPWPKAFNSWADQIKCFVGGELYESLICNFSTTDNSSRVASQIVMMDIFETYFKYRVVGICGIPSITLRGTEDDWDQLAKKTRALRVFDMDWWLDALEPLVDALAESRHGIVNVEHWQNICKRTEAYGGDEINGWIAYFFPYLREPGQDPGCRKRNRIFEDGRGFSTLSAPTGLSQVPFVWQHQDGSTRLMKAVGGLVGVKQSETLALEPVTGWAVSVADPLDALLFEVEKSVTNLPAIDSHTSASEPEDNRQCYRNYMPDDLDRFFREFGDVIELALRGSGLTIVFRFPRLEEALEWNEQPEKHGSSYGPFGRSWFKFADLSNSKYLAINLDPNCPGRYRDYNTGTHVPFKLRGPIAVCSAGSVGKETGNPVIALSFSELLENLLLTDSANGYFWEAESFKTYGEAQDMTRVESRR